MARSRERGTSPSRTARVAEALKLFVEGMRATEVAARMGVSVKTASRYQADLRADIDAASKAKRDGVVDGATRAKALLSSKVEAAAQGVVDIAARARAGKLRKDVQVKAAALELKAHVVVLDRGGVPAKIDPDATGSVLEAIHGVLERARKGAK